MPTSNGPAARRRFGCDPPHAGRFVTATSFASFLTTCAGSWLVGEGPTTLCFTQKICFKFVQNNQETKRGRALPTPCLPGGPGDPLLQLLLVPQSNNRMMMAAGLSTLKLKYSKMSPTQDSSVIGMCCIYIFQSVVTTHFNWQSEKAAFPWLANPCLWYPSCEEGCGWRG